MPSDAPSDIHFEKRGRAGVITLDRQGALNAVTDQMLRGIDDHLTAWENDEGVERVIIKAVAGKAFSAGGDIRHLYDRGMAGDYDFDFFAREYVLNARIAAYPKPYIALINGIAMGGGVGVSFHGSHVIAGDRISFAMPEVGIGFFPDVGGSYLLSRLPGHMGLYLGLTGQRIKQGDCVATGLATHACGTTMLDQLETDLCEQADLDEVLGALGNPSIPLDVLGKGSLIDITFSAGSVEEILLRLESMQHDESSHGRWAEKTLETLLEKSPTSLEIAFRQIKAGKDLSMTECMKMEYRILKRILPGKDFYEGIRAAIIDKDANPTWTPPTLDAVDAKTIDQYFAPLGDEELPL
ncbi:enoyl-CoA hydratase/isomerase family protein [Pseudahrensia aquimaris]|uniref:3-hydroxyisobutyryl-CoA hydrolase n=1 Tax=Pseudahrensia aquimaris TaxID=744461 RepID=A0ABW3FB17_9HYPH